MKKLVFVLSSSVKWWLFFGLLLAFCHHCFLSMKKTEITLKNVEDSTYAIPMTHKDMRRLEKFFRLLILEDYFGYTLLGNKPISLGVYREFSPHLGVVDNYPSLLPKNKTLRLGWKTWLKYQHHFTNTPYRLWIERSPWIKNGVLIVLAHQEKVSTMIHKHAADFSTVLTASEIEDLTAGNYSIPFLSGQLCGS